VRAYPYTHPNLVFVQGDVTRLPFPDGSFHAVTCISTLEHIGIGYYTDPQSQDHSDDKAMQELARVLAPGGLAVVTVPFGVPCVTTQQRVYGRDDITRITKGLTLLKKSFFMNYRVPDSRANYWREVDEAEAAKVAMPQGTDSICAMVLRR
jgi:ubiquinone/menaquinone biosynthesis C-methylase UbiE